MSPKKKKKKKKKKKERQLDKTHVQVHMGIFASPTN